MGEITRERVDIAETEEERKKRKKAKKKLKKARRKLEAAELAKKNEGVVAPVRAVPARSLWLPVPVSSSRRDPYSSFSHNRSAHQQSVDGFSRIAGYPDREDNYGY